MADVKSIVASNLTMLRKHRGLTQAELAAQFNYSDKAVCRWEHGDTLPDINILVALCEFYDITMNDLVDPECTIESVERIERDTRMYHILLCVMLGAVVWLAATVWFLVSTTLYSDPYWLAFIWAIPLSSIIVMRSGRAILPTLAKIILSSVFVWSVILGIFLHLLVVHGANVWMIFFIGLPLQVITMLWSKLRRYRQSIL